MSEVSDQTARMRWLIRVFVDRTSPFCRALAKYYKRLYMAKAYAIDFRLGVDAEGCSWRSRT